ncbi:VOC family protein [Micrococcus luteus]|uniref:VOC family protein n=1 Tax=Micrococcus luteus TaxID=1270 RepID=UPI001CA63548|nr:VOC family protein [Micrococcus luteus]QZY84368.1 VOC family protein [Micrococcus luteus]
MSIDAAPPEDVGTAPTGTSPAPTGTSPAPEALEDPLPHPSDPSVTPFLLFEGDAGAAMDAYLTAFVEHLPVTEVRRDLFDDSSPRGAEWAGKVLHGELEIAGQRLRFFDSFTPHGFTFTPAISLFVELPDATAVDAIHDALLAGGGRDHMPPDDYGFSRRFAWVGDRFGVTWQLNAA